MICHGTWCGYCLNIQSSHCLLLKCQELDDSIIPTEIPLSSEHISDEGIYLLENGEDCLIYVGNSVQKNVLQQLFGISSVEEISNKVHFYMFNGLRFLSEYVLVYLISL